MKPDEKETKTEAAIADAPARRPYHAPQLRRLGSVRDLTLGTGTMMPDSAGQLSGKFM
jgi:hypothetical protein